MGMSALRFAVFPTALGPFGIAWSERGIVGIQLPEAREAATRQRMLSVFPDAQEAPPPAGARWAPYRTAASWYLWRAAERPFAVTPPRA